MSEAAKVRPARAEDLEAAARILVEGFWALFEPAFRGHKERAERTLARTLALEVPRGLPGLYVAELEGQVVGIMSLRRREDPEPLALPALGVFVEELGLLEGVRATFYLSLLGQSCTRSEVYVSDVAVATPFRRRGIAHSMLEHAERVARFWGKGALVLDVDARNEDACRLYRQLDYVEQRRRHSLLTRWLLGIGTWIRMRKEL